MGLRFVAQVLLGLYPIIACEYMGVSQNPVEVSTLSPKHSETLYSNHWPWLNQPNVYCWLTSAIEIPMFPTKKSPIRCALFFPHIKGSLISKTKRHTPPKINMESENDGF